MKCLVEELGANVDLRNSEGQTAQEKIEAEGDFPEVHSYLQSLSSSSRPGQEAAPAPGTAGGAQAPPPLPPNVQINMGTMEELPPPTANGDGGVDPEFRRRIEELASRDDFQTAEGQAQLRDLITEAVRGVADDSDDRGAPRARTG
ncbi:MAG: hypothetical protein INR71_14680 [Terriglobus roseus]|nr:hypothetical protein [Terriglobus roseus]